MKTTIRIGTRGSELALWQAHHIAARLETAGQSTSIHIITTKGDKEQELSFDKIEGKGFFTKEIEAALLSNEVDIAVHSHKDLETTQPEGLMIGAVSERADPCDVLIISKNHTDPAQLFEVRENAVVGTSSARRKSLMKYYRPDITLKDIRGNLPTRIQKLRDGVFDAILLAAAGLDRLELDLSEFHVVRLDPEEFIPAPAQGVLAVQCRTSDAAIIDILSAIHQPAVSELVHLERTVLQRMEGGCHLPLGVYALKHENEFDIHVSVAPTWDGPMRHLTFTGDDQTELIELIMREIKP